MKEVINALGAFNYNAGTHIAYAFANNIWSVIIVISVAIMIFLSVFNALESTVTEEQNIM